MQKTFYKRKNKKFFFSIICATLGNKQKIKKLCNSLIKQNYNNFELIVCDQNQNNLNLKILKQFKNLKYKYLKTKKGLSRSRNMGILKCKGDLLMFLDDDTEIKRNHLKNINQEFNKKEIDIICYKVINDKKKNLLKYPNKKFYINNFNQIFNYISSVSFTIKYNKFLKFDEKIGLGSNSIFQSGEETDLIIREFKKRKFKIFFNNTLEVLHNEKKIKLIKNLNKKFLYGCGWSYVIKKQNFGYIFIIKNFLKIFFNISYHIISLKLPSALLSISTLLGRIYGLSKI